MKYDRMNPTLPALIKRLTDYTEITYGTDAYALSTAEAKLIVGLQDQVKKLTRKVEYAKASTNLMQKRAADAETKLMELGHTNENE